MELYVNYENKMFFLIIYYFWVLLNLKMYQIVKVHPVQ